MALAFSPDDAQLAGSFIRDGRNLVAIRSWPDGAWVRETEVPFSAERLRFSPDGGRILLMGKFALILDAGDGEILTTLDGHEDWILGGSFSPDGHWAVTTSADGTARVWKASNGALHAVIRGHTRSVLDACFPDGDRLLTVSNDGTVRTWPLDPLTFAQAHKPRELKAAECERWLGGP